MFVTFHGATREVTGSFHTLTTADDTILLDCGMFQGRRREAEEKNRQLSVDARHISNVILSHGHIDHSGRLPLLVKEGFSGDIFCTRGTRDASAYLLRDAAKIQEGDANYLNYKTARNFLRKVKNGNNPENISRLELKKIQENLKSSNHQLKWQAIEKVISENNLKKVTPLYTQDAAENSLSYFHGVPYKTSFTVGKNMECTFYDAGHILGSAISIIQYKNGNGETKTLMYSGDVGRFNKPIIEDPTLIFEERHRKIDLCIMESTYGDRFHDPVPDMKPQLKKVLIETFKRGGSVLIPAFAFGRTQELIYYIHELYQNGEVPRRPVYIDSPLATKLTQVFGEHPEVYDENTHQTFLAEGKNPFAFDMLSFVGSIEESMELNKKNESHIVIAGSGMCEGGRILHHLRHRIHDERNTVLIVGYMGSNTFGRRIQDLGTSYQEGGRVGEPPLVRFYNKDYPLKAQVVSLGGFSAHGDRDELSRLIFESNLDIKRLAIVHGEEDQCQAFGEYLRGCGKDVIVPHKGQTVVV